MGASFVRISGHGVRFLPRAPFVIRSLGAVLEVACIVDAIEQQMAIDAGTLRAEHPVGDVFDGPEDDNWLLEVGGVYAVPWPAGLTLRSWPEPEEPPFYMLEDDSGGLLYVQGPFGADDLPDRDGMVAEGQRELGRDEDGALRWIDLGYDHDDVPWRQRHVIVELTERERLVVTAQARAESAEGIEAAALAVARSIESGPIEPTR